MPYARNKPELLRGGGFGKLRMSELEIPKVSFSPEESVCALILAGAALVERRMIRIGVFCTSKYTTSRWM
jgi:hypothetical protein